MPIYEYEPDDRICYMCDGRVEVIQGINDEPLKLCPYCGLDVKKVVSRATFQLSIDTGPDKAANLSFTKYKRAEKGVWEKVGGEGADYLVGSPEDMKAIEEEKKPRKILDLDKPTE